MTPKSLNPSKLTHGEWSSTVFEVSTEIRTEDVSYLVTSQTTRNADLLGTLFQDAERKTEVSLRSLSASEPKQFHEANKTELDQWMHHSVYSIASRSGVPKHRIMTMRWVLIWKIVPGQDDRKAKARLVVRGFQDPDLQVLGAEAPI